MPFFRWTLRLSWSICLNLMERRAGIGRTIRILFNMLYAHAVRRFGLAKNPVLDLERTLITHKPIKTLSMDQVLSLI